MLCELCNKNEASCVLRRKGENGEDEELYVCRDCLEKESGGGERRPARRGKITSAIISPDGKEPPEFIKNFLDAAVGFIEGVAEGAPAEATKCSVCGTTWEKIKETDTLGCPDCWTVFARNLREEYLAGAYAPTHKGKIPERSEDGKPSRAFLERELRNAVERQDYRKAADLKKLLDKMDKKDKGGKKDGEKND